MQLYLLFLLVQTLISQLTLTLMNKQNKRILLLTTLSILIGISFTSVTLDHSREVSLVLISTVYGVLQLYLTLSTTTLLKNSGYSLDRIEFTPITMD